MGGLFGDLLFFVISLTYNAVELYFYKDCE